MIVNGDDLGFLIDDEDILTGYRFPELAKRKKLRDDDLSDYVKWRLFLARQLALLKYREVHG